MISKIITLEQSLAAEGRLNDAITVFDHLSTLQPRDADFEVVDAS